MTLLKRIKDPFRVLEYVVVLVTLTISIVALLQSAQATRSIQCFEEQVPKTIAVMQNLEAIKQRALSQQVEYQGVFVNMIANAQIYGEEGGDYTSKELIADIVSAIRIGALSIESLRSSLNPYLLEKEKAALRDITSYGESDSEVLAGNDRAVEEILENALESIGEIGEAMENGLQFVDKLIAAETSKSISELCQSL